MGHSIHVAKLDYVKRSWIFSPVRTSTWSHKIPYINVVPFRSHPDPKRCKNSTFTGPSWACRPHLWAPGVWRSGGWLRRLGGSSSCLALGCCWAGRWPAGSSPSWASAAGGNTRYFCCTDCFTSSLLHVTLLCFFWWKIVFQFVHCTVNLFYVIYWYAMLTFCLVYYCKLITYELHTAICLKEDWHWLKSHHSITIYLF